MKATQEQRATARPRRGVQPPDRRLERGAGRAGSVGVAVLDRSTVQRLQASAGNAAVVRLLAQRGWLDGHGAVTGVAVQRLAPGGACPAPPVAPPKTAPGADPRFRSVKADVAAKKKQVAQHPPATAESKAAQDAAVAPPDDKQAQGKAAQAEKMNAAKPGTFDKVDLVSWDETLNPVAQRLDCGDSCGCATCTREQAEPEALVESSSPVQRLGGPSTRAVQRGLSLNPLDWAKELAKKALGAILRLGASAFNTAKRLGTAAWDKARSAGGGIVDAARSAGSSLASTVKGLGTSAWNTAKNLGAAAWNKAKSGGASLWAMARSAGAGVANAAMTLGKKAWGGATSLGSTLLSGARRLGGSALRAVSGFGRNALGKLRGLVTAAVTTVKGLGQRVAASARGIVSKLSMSDLCGAISALAGKVVAAVGSLMRKVRGLTQKVGRALKAVGSAVTAFASRWAGKLAGFATRALSKAFSTVKTLAAKGLSAIKRLGANAWSSAKRLASGLVSTARGLAAKALSKAKQLGGKVAEKAKAAGSKIAATARTAGAKLLSLADRLSGGAASKVAGLAGKIMSKASGLLSWVVSKARSLASKATDTVKSLGAKAIDAAKTAGAKALTTARDWGSKALTTARSWGGKAWGAIRAGGARVKDFAKQAGGKVWGKARKVGSGALQVAKAVGLDKAVTVAKGLGRGAAKTAKDIAAAAGRFCDLLKKFGWFINGLKKLMANPGVITDAIRNAVAPMVARVPGQAQAAATQATARSGSRAGSVQRLAVQRQAATTVEPSTSQQQEESVWQGIWRHLGPKLQYLKDNWWEVLKQTGRQLLFPWEGMGKELSELWAEIKKGWDALKSFQISKLIDAYLAVQRLVLGLAGRWYGWFAIASVIIGAVIGAFFGGAGAGPGALAGAKFALAVGEGLVIAEVGVQTTSILKAAYNLGIQGDTGQDRESDYEQIASSGLTIGILGALVLLSALAVRFGKALLGRVRGLFDRPGKPKAPPKTEPPQTEGEGPIETPTFTTEGAGTNQTSAAEISGQRFQFNRGHGYREHRTGPSTNPARAGTPEAVETAIARDVLRRMQSGETLAGRPPPIANPGPTVVVNGVTIRYNVIRLPDGRIRISDYMAL